MHSFSPSPRPKLDRTNARKIPESDLQPSDSPRLTHLLSSSFRITGQSSQQQISRLCEELGLSGGVDAFSISADAWEAGKSRANSAREVAEKESLGYGFRSHASDGDLLAPPSTSFSNDSLVGASAASAEAVEDHVQVHEVGNAAVRSPLEQDGDSNVGESILAEQFVRQTSIDPDAKLTQGSRLTLAETNEMSLVENNDGYPQDTSQSQGDTSSSSFESSVKNSEDETEFVSRAVQQHGVSVEDDIFPATSSNGLDATSSNGLEMQASPVNMVSINSWRKLDMLGSGAFGTVYEALSEDGIYFAVKEVSLSEKDSKAQESAMQLEKEIELLSRFQHENIVRYFGAQKEPSKLYIFLELVSKGSLASLYQKYPLFDSQIRKYSRQILSGLKYLHDHNIMHRDIKCANILVDVNGTIKLADFGLAKQISKLDELKSCKGSAYWMAPEVIDPRKVYSLPADIWSLGCTVLEMATRRPPFGDMEWHRVLWQVGHGESPPIPDSLSEDTKDFIGRCLEVDPGKRPSAAQLLQHPFVRCVSSSGFTPRSSYSQEFVECQQAVVSTAASGS